MALTIRRHWKGKTKAFWHKQNRDPYYECEYRLKFKDGKYRWILSKSKRSLTIRAKSYEVQALIVILQILKYPRKVEGAGLQGLFNRIKQDILY